MEKSHLTKGDNIEKVSKARNTTTVEGMAVTRKYILYIISLRNVEIEYMHLRLLLYYTTMVAG